MDVLPIIKQLLFGLFLGSVIGLEREIISQKAGKVGFAGLRTFALLGMSGVILSFIEIVSPVLFLVLVVGLVALLVSSYIITTKKNEDAGGTTEVAQFIVLMSGYLVGINEEILATIITIITVVLLYSKQTLHYLVSKVTKPEMTSIIQFIVIWLIVLPLLPNESFGPYQALNPYVIWLMVVLISAISFVGYLGIKIFGASKGISLTGFLGGLISSTAVSLSFSQNSKKYKKIIDPFVFGISIASAAMFFRIFVEVLVINPDLLDTLWIPLVASGMTGVILSGVLWFTKLRDMDTKKLKSTEISPGKPLDLVGALKFGLLFALILVISKAASIEFGEQGIYVTSIVSGLVDTDAIAISLANLAKNGLPESTAVIGITLATVTNTLVKGFIVLAFASRKVAWRTFGIVLVMAAVGLASLLLII